ncbi:hypothetical protein [Microbacterium cremeum]|uniref:hypothetical protein n=1 Tax=Microbacterium cremeum TaxID=2782169 RepID=UPI001888D680|nr:hypothetical protein [Microbacterium cremeum]
MGQDQSLLAPASHVRAVPISVDWGEVAGTNRTTLTTHLWAAPPLRRESPIHDRAFSALRDLKVDYARFLPWFSHPVLSVPALEAPTEGTTSWDFSKLDPFVEDFVAAAEGRPIVANFATIPHWMFTNADQVHLSHDVDEIHWEYEQGADFRDESLAEVADYFFRVASWYIAGGFTDEIGQWHESGHDYRFAYWEVLCEPDLNRRMSPEVYTRLYDAVVERLQPLDPDMKFVGLSLSHVHHDPEYFWHFLDAANHKPGVGVDAFSYHFYASPEIVNPFGTEGNADPLTWRSTFFAQADAFVENVAYIRSIAQRLAPDAKTFLNEIGTYPADVMNPAPQIPDFYWTLSGSLHAYLWARLLPLGIDLFGVAEFMDYPGMIPGTSLIDWETGEPNARYHVTQLLLSHFARGDSLVATSAGDPGFPDMRVHAQAIIGRDAEKSLLLINKWDEFIDVDLSSISAAGAGEQVHVGTSGIEPIEWSGGVLRLEPHATVVLTIR